MALRIGQPQAVGFPAVLPEEELPVEAPMEEAPMALPDEAEPGSVAEWLQEALDICRAAQCPEELGYALEQALVMLLGPSAVEATESVEEMPVSAPEEVPAEPEDEEE